MTTTEPNAPSEHPDDVALAAFADSDALDATAELPGHVRGCARCARRVDLMREAAARLADLGEEAPPAPDSERRRAAVQAALAGFDDAADLARNTRRRWRAAGLAAAAAAAVVAVVTIGVNGTSPSGGGNAVNSTANSGASGVTGAAARPAAASHRSAGNPAPSYVATGTGRLQLRPLLGVSGCVGQRAQVPAAASGVVASDLPGAPCLRVGPTVGTVPTGKLAASTTSPGDGTRASYRLRYSAVLALPRRPLVAVVDGRLAVADVRVASSGHALLFTRAKTGDLLPGRSGP